MVALSHRNERPETFYIRDYCRISTSFFLTKSVRCGIFFRDDGCNFKEVGFISFYLLTEGFDALEVFHIFTTHIAKSVDQLNF